VVHVVNDGPKTDWKFIGCRRNSLVVGVFIQPEERNVRPMQVGEVLAVWPPIAGG
jgi:hypothetical protein